MTVAKILEKVRYFAKQAKKSGKGWHVAGGGNIQCENDRCTLGAIAWQVSEAGRKEQAAMQKEYNAFVAKVKKDHDALLSKLEKKQPIEDHSEPFEYEADLSFEDTDGGYIGDNPGADEAADVIEGLSDEVAQVIIQANDYGLPQQDEGTVHYKARQILEEVLLGKKPKKAA